MSGHTFQTGRGDRTTELGETNQFKQVFSLGFSSSNSKPTHTKKYKRIFKLPRDPALFCFKISPDVVLTGRRVLIEIVTTTV